MVFVFRIPFYVVRYESVSSLLNHFAAGCISTELGRVEIYGFNFTLQRHNQNMCDYVQSMRTKNNV